MFSLRVLKVKAALKEGSAREARALALERLRESWVEISVPLLTI